MTELYGAFVDILYDNKYACARGGDMDHNKVGKLILSLRKEKGLTQKELADAMNLSDRTVSKWERGLGCPDVSLV